MFLSIAMNFASYFFSDRIALRMYSAQAVSREEAPRLYSMIEYLCSRAGIPMPRIYVIPEESPNAFATGRIRSTPGGGYPGSAPLMDENELQGVLAHELSHVKNRDILISSVAATMAGIIMWIANIARFAAFFGGGSRDREEGSGLYKRFHHRGADRRHADPDVEYPRTREYEADASGAAIVGSHGLASALQKLENYSKRIPMEASPSTAHMFIVHPFSGSSLVPSLFSTHPADREAHRAAAGS